LGNSSLKEIKLDFGGNEDGDNRINWEAIFNALQRSRCRLEKLDVSYSPALSLSNALHRHNTTLKTLDLSGFSNHYDPDENIDDNMTLTGWRFILLPLQDHSSAVRYRY
jgi:hypothetical protein